jgi:hypothetical protein
VDRGIAEEEVVTSSVPDPFVPSETSTSMDRRAFDPHHIGSLERRVRTIIDHDDLMQVLALRLKHTERALYRGLVREGRNDYRDLHYTPP